MEQVAEKKKKPKRTRSRANGEGSIYRMKDGRWRSAITVGWKFKDGNRIPERQTFTDHTRQAVSEKRDKALQDLRCGINLKGSKQTVGEFLAEWLRAAKETNRIRPKTYRSYEQQVRNHLAKTVPVEQWKEKKLDSVPGLKDVPLRKLSVVQLDRFWRAKLAAGNSPEQVAYLRIVLRAALTEAQRQDLVPRNVAELSTPPKRQKRNQEPYTLQQAAQFLCRAGRHRLKALYYLDLGVGLRSGECGGLRWPDLELEAETLIGYVTVRHTLQRNSGPGLSPEEKGLILGPPKSASSKRRIKLPPSVVAALLEHRARQQQERAAAGELWKDGGPACSCHEGDAGGGHVFTTLTGGPLEPDYILKQFNALSTAAGVPKRNFHGLRRTCASILKVKGVPLKDVAETLGHSDPRLTQDIYQGIYDEGRTETAAKMDEFLAPLMGSAEPTATTTATNSDQTLVNRMEVIETMEPPAGVEPATC